MNLEASGNAEKNFLTRMRIYSLVPFQSSLYTYIDSYMNACNIFASLKFHNFFNFNFYLS